MAICCRGDPCTSCLDTSYMRIIRVFMSYLLLQIRGQESVATLTSQDLLSPAIFAFGFRTREHKNDIRYAPHIRSALGTHHPARDRCYRWPLPNHIFLLIVQHHHKRAFVDAHFVEGLRYVCLRVRAQTVPDFPPGVLVLTIVFWKNLWSVPYLFSSS